MKKLSTPTPESVKSLHNEYLREKQGFPYGDGDRVENCPEVANSNSALAELLRMTGMQEIKDAVVAQINFHKIMKLRRSAGRPAPKRLMHILLTGNPGTGKTTVARLIGRIYKEEGILSRGHLIESNRASLVGRYIGESEQKTVEALQAAEGGILFIDEMYSLVEVDRGEVSSRDFGAKVIDTLMPRLSDPDSNVVIIGAGYKSNMKTFLDSNPGLLSRFPVVLDFNDFSIDELMEIVVNELKRNEFILTFQAREAIIKLFREVTSRVKNHGNGRLALNIVNNYILPNLCNRLAVKQGLRHIDIEQTSIIKKEDVPSFETLFPLNNKLRQAVGFTTA